MNELGTATYLLEKYIKLCDSDSPDSESKKELIKEILKERFGLNFAESATEYRIFNSVTGITIPKQRK